MNDFDKFVCIEQYIKTYGDFEISFETIFSFASGLGALDVLDNNFYKIKCLMYEHNSELRK